MEDDRTDLYRQFENKKILIRTKSGFTYNTINLIVSTHAVSFIDKLGHKVMLSFDDIAKIEEVF